MTHDHPSDTTENNPKISTIEHTLDPARSLMYRMARNAGGPVFDEFLAEQIEDAIEQAYDSRDQFRDAFEDQQPTLTTGDDDPEDAIRADAER